MHVFNIPMIKLESATKSQGERAVSGWAQVMNTWIRERSSGEGELSKMSPPL